MEYYSAIKRNELPINAIDLKNATFFESQKHYKCKKKDTNGYILYNSISMIF